VKLTRGLAAVPTTALLLLTLASCAKKADQGTTADEAARGGAEDVSGSKGDFGSATKDPQAIPSTPTDVEMEDEWRRIEASLKPVFYDFDKYNLKPEARAALTDNAAVLRGKPDVKVFVEGHCDERGTNEYNLALGERRARAAKDYLVQAGVAADRMLIISYGEERPFALGHDESAWWQNRRAHFRVRR
jgi:peptidoglycan-associated lipoprotein